MESQVSDDLPNRGPTLIVTDGKMMPQPEDRKKVRSRKQLFGGRETAEEVHSKHAFPPGSKCAGCQRSRGLIMRIIILAPVDEISKRDPFFARMVEECPQQFMEIIVRTKYGVMLRLSTTYACHACQRDAERAAAKAPSWCIVDINRGPGKDKIVVGVEVQLRAEHTS